jgi:hypothetical protein
MDPRVKPAGDEGEHIGEAEMHLALCADLCEIGAKRWQVKTRGHIP